MSASPAVEASPTGARKATVIGTILLGAFVFSLNARGTILESELIVQAFELDHYKIQWITGLEGIAGLTSLFSSIYLIKVFGARRVFLAGTVCLTVGCLGEALARTPWQLGVAGVVRSCAGFYTIPGLTMLQRLLPQRRRFAYCTYLTLVYGGQVVVEPLGALLAFNPSWRAVYAILGACGVWFVLSGLFLFDDDRPEQQPEHGFDFAGAALFMVVLGLIFFLLYRGNYLGWRVSTPIWVAAAALVAGLALFMWRELVAPEPFIDLGGFTFRTVALSMLASAFWCASLYGVAIQLPNCLLVLGYEHWKTGWVILPMCLIVVATMFLGGFVSQRGQLVWLFRIGLAGMTVVGFWLARIDIYTPWQWVMGVSSPVGRLRGDVHVAHRPAHLRGATARSGGGHRRDEVLHALLQRDGGHPAGRRPARPGRLVGAGVRPRQHRAGPGGPSGRHAPHPRPPGAARQRATSRGRPGRRGPRLLGQPARAGDRLPPGPALLRLPERGRADRLVFHPPAEGDQCLRHRLTPRSLFHRWQERQRDRRPIRLRVRHAFCSFGAGQRILHCERQMEAEPVPIRRRPAATSTSHCRRCTLPPHGTE